MKFVSLHNHDGFSIGDGFNYPEDHYKFVVENAESDSMGLATTNHGNINSLGYMIQAQNALKKRGIDFKIIVGNEMYIHPDLNEWRLEKEKLSLSKKESSEETESVIEIESESKDKSKWYNPVNRRHHLVVLAQNQKGISNLFTLTSLSYKEGFYRYPRVDFKMLEKYNEGLIVSSACLHPASELITDRGIETIQSVVKRFKQGDEVFVLCQDLDKERTTFERVSWGDVTRRGANLMKITLKNGKVLKLTPDHRVYTQRGWVQVQDLEKTDQILNLK